MVVSQERVTAEIGNRLRTARAERRWTLDELAARSTVSRRLLVQIEHAQANPSLATLLKLAAALGMTLTELVTEEPETDPVGVVTAQDATTLWSTPAAPRLRVAVPIWRDPWMVVGSQTYTDDLLTRAGLTNVLAHGPAEREGRYPTVTPDDIDGAGADVKKISPALCRRPVSASSLPTVHSSSLARAISRTMQNLGISRSPDSALARPSRNRTSAP